MTFKEAYDQLNTAQKQAVDTIEGPVLVIAGPGTGKTQLLALRAANILDKTDVQPQNILCLTYTEVGARNMRDRLTQYIGKSAYDIRISTYHGFGSEVIRGYGEYFNEYGASQPIDAIGQDVILHEIYETLPASNALWRPEVYLKDALGFISESKRALLTPKDLRTIAKSNLAFIQLGSKLASQHLASLVRMDKTVLPLFESLFVDLQSKLIDQKLPGAITRLDAMAVTALAEAIVGVQETSKTNTLTAWKNAWLIKDTDNKWIFAGTKEVNKLLGGADILEAYTKKLSDKQLFDYDDMILRAIAGLKQHDELRYTLQERFQYIMLDEFQDTNLAQLELIQLLTNNPANEGKPNILAVGDDDQAIFSFQGADPGVNMLKFHSLYKDVTSITLTENWRSHADILQVGRAVSDQIEERLHTRLGFAQKILEAKNPNLPKQSKIARHEFKSDVAELAWVAKQVKDLLKKGTNPSQIAVIAPKHKYLEPLVPFLTQQDVPVRYDKRENVLDDPHILDIISSASLVTALAANDQAAANALWPSVLSASEWQLPTSTIWQLSWQANKNYYDGAETSWQALMLENEVLRPITLYYTKLALLASTETLETMLDYLTGVQPVALNEPDLADYTNPYFAHFFSTEAQTKNPVLFTQLLSNLTVLRQHLREYKKDADAPLTLQDLLEFVTAYRNANQKLLNTSPYHSASDAVQLMTAYGAKGLEFEVVFVLATLDDVWGMKARGQSSNITLPANLQLIRRAGSSKDEHKRLFYVALTRAKHTLIMTSHLQNFAGKDTTRLEFLGEAEDNGRAISSSLPASQQVINQTDIEPPELITLERFWQQRHFDDAAKPKLQDYLKPRLENFQLSATHVNTFTDLVYGGPQAFFINTILRFPKAPTADGQYGNAIHETIEAVQNFLRANQELPDIEQILPIFDQKLRAKRLSKADFDRQQGRGHIALQAFMQHWWPNFDPTNQSETNFKDEGVFIGDAHMSGALDQLIIDQEEMAVQVIDFKTGKPHTHWTKDVKMHKYRQQLLIYKLLVEGSHSYGKYTVRLGRLVFVEPNDDAKIDEVTLEYNDQELEHTKQLIQAIWQRIMALDFPDTSAFSADLKGITAFEDWLIENSK